MAAAFALLLGVLVPGLALTTSAPANASDDGEKVTFTVGLRNEVDSFNPFLGILVPSYEAWALTYDYMIGYDNTDMSITKTGLATDWETSEDGKTWTFHIRDGVTWSDGEDLTADDIAYTYNRILDGGPEAVTWGSYLTEVTTITAPDPQTVVLELKKPNAVLPLLPIPIIPEHIWKDVSEKQVKTYTAEPTGGQPVVGSGPFRLVEGTAGGSTYRFEANPDYWGGAPHIDEVIFRVYKADDPMAQALIKGEIDFAENLPAVQINALQGKPGITAINGDSPGFEEIAFNTGAVDTETDKPIGDGNPALEDAAFRHALGYAVDYDALVERVYQGAAKPGFTIIPPAYSTYHWAPPEDEAFTFDLDKAGELLDEAGYTMGDDGLRTMPNGDPIGTIRLYARAESPTSQDTMAFFKEWLGDIGITAEVKSFEDNNLTSIILEGNFDAFAWGWYVEPDPNSMLSYMTCGQLGGWSDSWYCDDQYDAMYTQQATELDESARAEIVKQMQQQLYEDSPYLVTVYDVIGEAFRSDRWACLQPQPDPGGILLMQYGVSSYLSIRPADEADQCEAKSGTQATSSSGSDEGISTGVLIGIGVAAGVAVIAGGVVAMRRRRTVGDRE